MDKKLLDKLGNFLNAMDSESLSKKDFLEAFKRVVDFVKNMEVKKDAEMIALRQAVKQITDKLASDSTMSHDKLHKEVDSLFVGDRIKKIEEAHSGKLKELDEFKKGIKSGRDGNHGRDGKNSDPELVAARVLAQIQEELKELKELKTLKEDVAGLKSRPVVISGNTGRDLFREKDLSSQLNGVLKTFNIGAFYRIISADLSSYPYGSLRKGVDYTYNGALGTITFGDSITADTQLAAGQQLIISFVVA